MNLSILCPVNSVSLSVSESGNDWDLLVFVPGVACVPCRLMFLLSCGVMLTRNGGDDTEEG